MFEEFLETCKYEIKNENILCHNGMEKFYEIIVSEEGTILKCFKALDNLKCFRETHIFLFATTGIRKQFSQVMIKIDKFSDIGYSRYFIELIIDYRTNTIYHSVFPEQEKILPLKGYISNKLIANQTPYIEKNKDYNIYFYTGHYDGFKDFVYGDSLKKMFNNNIPNIVIKTMDTFFGKYKPNEENAKMGVDKFLQNYTLEVCPIIKAERDKIKSI